MYQRQGCIYTEQQRNTGKGVGRGGGMAAPHHFVRGVGRVSTTKYVAEFSVHGKRYRFRSTNVQNCEWWLKMMREKYKNEPWRNK